MINQRMSKKLLTAEDVKRHNGIRRASLGEKQYSSTNDPNYQKNKALMESRKKNKKVIGGDNKPFLNQYLQNLSRIHTGCNRLKNDEDQNEWKYVRGDFRVATKQFEMQRDQNNVNLLLEKTVHEILTIRRDMSLIKNQNNDIRNERNERIKEHSNVESDYNAAHLRRKREFRKSNPNIFHDRPPVDDDDDDNDGGRKERDYEIGKCDQEHIKLVNEKKQEIEELKNRIRDKLNSLSNGQKDLLRSFEKEIEDTSTNESIQFHENATAESHATLLQKIKENHSKEEEAKEKLQDKQDEYDMQMEAAKETVNRLHEKNEKLKLCHEEKIKKDKLELKISSSNKDIKDVIKQTEVYKSHVEDMQIAIQHEMRMKQLSTLNPISMLDFYHKRATGADDATHTVLFKIKRATAKEKEEYLKRKSEEAAENARIEREQKRLAEETDLSKNKNGGETKSNTPRVITGPSNQKMTVKN